MTDETSLDGAILDRPSFRQALRAIGLASIREDLDNLATSDPEPDADWSFALFCCSALTRSDSERAQAAVLRVAQGCLTARQTNAVQKQAAALLLQRLGNRPALDLAEQRQLLAEPDSVNVPLELEYDALSRTAELTISTRSGELEGNAFQAEFWRAAGRKDWVSFSAPTSAGKSYIVRYWLRELFATRSELTAAYIAPTRALVEEVSGHLRADLGDDVAVVTLPWDPMIGASPRQMFVFTQERLHLLQQRSSAACPSLIFVDEAQKVGDGARGVLLSQVLDEAVRRRPDCQMIFASPLASNPELLIEGAPQGAETGAFAASTVTVNQNLLLVEQVPRKPLEYAVNWSIDGEQVAVGTVRLPARPTRDSQRLPFIAVALGGSAGGNVIYANRPSDAEKIAIQIYELLGEEADVHLEEVDGAIDYARSAIHEKYALPLVLRRGVAFHYGNMPLQVKAKVEALFRAGVVKYLVCTSTLLEGVNMPCRNIFLRGPQKGQGNPMTASDFWNLAGRAGRWGTEFQGNIVCVDVGRPRVWPTPPSARVRTALRRAADLDAAATKSLTRYIAAGATKDSPQEPQLTETMFSFLAARVLEGRSLDTLYGLASSATAVAEVQEATHQAVAALEVEPWMAARHAGISPVSIQRLMDAVRSHPAPEELPLVLPESDEAMVAYKEALDLIDESLGGPFSPEGRRWALARLIVHWMRGVPLNRIIDWRLDYVKSRDEGVVNVASVIRTVMTEVEEIARFQAPKYLACYSDVVATVAKQLRIPLSAEMPDVTMMLELGVPRETDMSFINLGLSRATTLAVSALVVQDRLDVVGCREWLMSHDIESLGLPNFAVREVLELLPSLSRFDGE